METLDGNAIGGALYEVFGTEMTAQTGICRSCGTASLVAELRVYTRAPGAVARCPSCDSVMLVLVEIKGTVRLHAGGVDLVS